MLRFTKSFFLVYMFVLVIGGCSPQTLSTQDLPITSTEVAPTLPNAQSTSTETISPTEPAQPIIPLNPLTGLPVEDSSLLDYPAALVSISHFPPAARPQAGLSFAPFVFEIYITEGATRFLTTFYGEFPEPQLVVNGNCEVRTSAIVQSSHLLGNRVWWDENQNQMQDAWERGIGGVCINLYDANQNLIQQTATDSNGYYAFNVSGGKYFIEVIKPDGMEFDQQHVGDENQDSDVDQATGRSDAVDVTSTLLNMDIGLTLLNDPTPTSELVPPLVGPVRSGRLVYRHIATFFPGSCLIFAYASAEVLVELPKCSFVDHILQGGGYMLEIDKLKQLVMDRKNVETRNDYASNIFSADAPDGGQPATRLDEFIAWLNQSAWVYDAASQTYWRYVDTADPDFAGVLHPEVDRLTNRQLQFDNVVVLFAKHDVISPTNLDIHLEFDWLGDAKVFRNGLVYDVRWSTRSTEDEVQSGHIKPIQFYYPDEKTLFPLKPGHTWVIVVTPETSVSAKLNDSWQLYFSQPSGAK